MTNCKRNTKNTVHIVGIVLDGMELNHKAYGKRFYRSFIKVERLSGNFDIVPLLFSEDEVQNMKNWVGQYVEVKGEFRSAKHTKPDGTYQWQVSVFAQTLKYLGEIDQTINKEKRIKEGNTIHLEGSIVRPPHYRKVRNSDKEVCDVLLRVEKSYGKSDYIPCITWGHTARRVVSLPVGTKLCIDGRVQSRNYQKFIAEGQIETRTTYEVSVMRVQVVKGDWEVEQDENRDCAGAV